uniref:Chlorophyllase n=1 Tax=Aegilops tauschii subsp. strangulata TaxID=200361 RepID=A0A453KUX0_AEGTS
RNLSCRASLGPDAPLPALAAPRPSPARGRTYLREHSCLLFPPPRGARPLAVVKFLGGAFIGAAPEATYGYLLELLAQEGFLVVCVPYNVTFDHAAAAREVFERFHGCYDALRASGLPEAGLGALDIAGLPLYSVGHSNGALLQLLVGSYFSEKIPKANAIVSFNNRPASEAVPYFEQPKHLIYW